MTSIFPTLSLRPEKSAWGKFLLEPTPVEERGSLLFKREDYFAPLGYGGINGSKLRQLIFLVEEAVRTGKEGLITGASIISPQIPMAAAVARHFGLPSTVVIGSTTLASAIRSPMVQMGAWFGATYDAATPVAFNPLLQKRVRDLQSEERFRNYFLLEYGITRAHEQHPPSQVLAFHSVGAEQVRYLPPEVRRIILPAGSCNSATSVLHGIAKFRPKNLEEVYLIGIGPSKLRLIAERLRIFQEETGIDHTIFAPTFEEDLPVLFSDRSTPFFLEAKERPYRLHFKDLHGTGQVAYHDRVPWTYEGIQFHPTYEGKVMRWLHGEGSELIRPGTLFWIVGSEPSLSAMEPLRGELGDLPETLTSL